MYPMCVTCSEFVTTSNSDQCLRCAVKASNAPMFARKLTPAESSWLASAISRATRDAEMLTAKYLGR